jgi:hypothetical protein
MEDLAWFFSLRPIRASSGGDAKRAAVTCELWREEPLEVGNMAHIQALKLARRNFHSAPFVELRQSFPSQAQINIRERAINGDDPLRKFSEICRRDLEATQG